MKFLAFIAAFAFLPMSAMAHDYNLGSLIVMHPVAKETTASARSSAGYLSIVNTGDAADTLLGVEAEFPRVMLHNTEVVDGVASMIHLDSIVIEPGETLTLEPGGMHVMFMGLSAPMTEGEKVPAVLVFEQAGRLEIDFNVEKINVVDHSNH